MNESIRLKVSSNNISLKSSTDAPIYIGARAYVEQTSDGARITCSDKLGETVADVYNGKQGATGEQGIGVDGIYIDNDFRLNITLTNGDTWTSPESIQGETGSGINSVIFNDDYTLTIVYGNGESITTPSIRGEKGEGAEINCISNDFINNL